MKYLLLTLLFLIISASESLCSTKDKLIEAALDRTEHQITYDGSYHSIPYPNGDVPGHIGVCTDVVIRSYRKIGIDLQQLVHEDMTNNFSKYPSRKIWGLNRPDSNIDHRRVPNLQVFFSRYGQTLGISYKAESYIPGDLVVWTLPGNLPHIGIVTNKYSLISNRLMIVHNIGRGPELDDMLFDYKIIGHYRYLPEL